MGRDQQKARRMRTLPAGLPGTSQGSCIVTAARPGQATPNCFCGSCSSKGRDFTKHVILRVGA